MQEPKTIKTAYSQYTGNNTGAYTDFYQLHIFSVPQIISTYYDPAHVPVEQVKFIADNFLQEVQKRSNRKNRVTLFETRGKFLIAEDTNLLDPGDLLVFNEYHVRYENAEGVEDFFYYIGGERADDIIKRALITVGAEELYEVVAPFAARLRKKQEEIEGDYIRWRELNRTDPKLKLEVYHIGKDYNPVLTHELLCHSYESAMFLPEHQELLNASDRRTFLLRDRETNKIMEGNLREAIEGLRLEAQLKKHPLLYDPQDLFRMELDTDDPDFIDLDTYSEEDEGYNDVEDEGDEEDTFPK